MDPILPHPDIVNSTPRPAGPSRDAPSAPAPSSASRGRAGPSPREAPTSPARTGFSAASLEMDPAEVVDQIAQTLRALLRSALKRRGLVIGLSGGIDSSVTAALAVRAIGPERVFGLLMPERHSSSESLTLGRLLAESLGIGHVVEDITRPLEGLRFYERYDEAVARAVPGYGPGWKSKIVLSPATERTGLSLYSVIARSPEGEEVRTQLRLQAYLEIVAATNFKQRVRKMLDYYHADRLHYAVVGTPNRLEYDQGFFVKGGDGLADTKPIAHLYKTQVYRLAEELGVPEGVTNRPPTTDTYSLSQSQEEFYFALPALTMDLVLYAHNHGLSAEEAAAALGLEPDQVRRAYRDVEQKRSTTRYLHLSALLVDPVPEIATYGGTPD